MQAPDGPGGLWALACAAAGPIIAVRSERTGPTEPLRLTERDVVAAPIRLVAAFSADRSWRPYSPRWCENYACTLCATVGGLRAGDRAPATSACGGGSLGGRGRGCRLGPDWRKREHRPGGECSLRSNARATDCSNRRSSAPAPLESGIPWAAKPDSCCSSVESFHAKRKSRSTATHGGTPSAC